ncbi:hypothetical protein ACFLTE_10670 [Bacteroidota bacterium]
MWRKIKGISYAKLFAAGIIFKLASFLLFSSLITGCKSFDKINVGDIQEVKVEGITGQNVFLEFKIPIENVSGLNVKINDVNLNVRVNDTYLGKVNNVEKIKIIKKSNEVYTIKLKLKIAGLFGALNSLKVFNAESGELNLTGEIKAKIMGLNKKIEVNETQIVEFSSYKDSLF